MTELHAAFERVLGLMLHAKWLVNFSFTDGKGWHLGWSAHGAQRSLALKGLIRRHQLLAGDGEAAIVRFNVLAEQGRARGAVPDHTLWREALAEVGVTTDVPATEILLHLVDGWAPGPDTPVKTFPQL